MNGPYLLFICLDSLNFYSTMNKFTIFNGFVYSLLDWYSHFFDKNFNDVLGGDNDLSKLKLLKLLFLSVAEDKEMLEKFNHFVAWELGPVEYDIYDEIISNGNKIIFSINNIRTKCDKKVNIDKESLKYGEEMVKNLRINNSKLIGKTPSNLVDITHQRRCWRILRLFEQKDMKSNIILASNRYYG